MIMIVEVRVYKGAIRELMADKVFLENVKTKDENYCYIISCCDSFLNYSQTAIMKFTGRLTKQLPHLLSTGDLSKQQLNTLLKHSVQLKDAFKKNAIPPAKLSIPKSLDAKTVAVLFNKRSTRTRVAAETSLQALGAFSYTVFSRLLSRIQQEDIHFSYHLLIYNSASMSL